MKSKATRAGVSIRKVVAHEGRSENANFKLSHGKRASYTGSSKAPDYGALIVRQHCHVKVEKCMN